MGEEALLDEQILDVLRLPDVQKSRPHGMERPQRIGRHYLPHARQGVSLPVGLGHAAQHSDVVVALAHRAEVEPHIDLAQGIDRNKALVNHIVADRPRQDYSQTTGADKRYRTENHPEGTRPRTATV